MFEVLRKFQGYFKEVFRVFTENFNYHTEEYMIKVGLVLAVNVMGDCNCKELSVLTLYLSLLSLQN